MSPGERVKKVRESLELTQTQFGEGLGFKWDKVKNIEIGRQKLTAEIALKIQEVYSVDYNWLMTGEGDMFLPVSADRMQYFQALPEPFQKMAKLFQAHPEKAWEFYAAALERLEKEKKGKK
jgi:transcriptional regulator with XRE-family HTH domain